MINAKVDTNHPTIRTQAKAAGLDWLDTFRLGDGAPDAIVSGVPRWGDRPVSVQVEIKHGKGKLTPKEQAYIDAMRYPGAYIVARDVEDILSWFGMI